MTLNKKIIKRIIVVLVFLAAMILRIVLLPYKTHWSDMLFWKNWGEAMAAYGPAGFYSRVASDYLPFYPLVLGLVKKTYDFFSPSFPIDYAYKLPAVVFDLLLGVLIWLFLKKQAFGKRIIFLGLWLFNPGIWGNSSLWGQVDVVGTFFVLAAFYLLLVCKKNLLAGILLGLGLVNKPIFLLSLPVFAAIFTKDWLTKSKLTKSVFLFFTASLATIWLVCANFIIPPKIFSLSYWLVAPYQLFIRQILANSLWYPYTTINAFNFWFLVDRQFWLTDQKNFLFLNFNQWGWLICVLLVSLVFIKIIFFTVFKKSYYYLLLGHGLLTLGGFLFMTRIHERHLYYTLPFLLLAAANRKRLLPAYLFLSLTYSLNLYFALENFLSGRRFNFSPSLIFALSLANLIIFLWLFLEFFLQQKKQTK